MTILRRTRLGRILLAPLSTSPLLSAGLLALMACLFLVISCSRTDEYGDDTVVNIDYYCPDVPSHVTCPLYDPTETYEDNESNCCPSDNTTVDNETVDNETVVNLQNKVGADNVTGEGFLFHEDSGSWGTGSMYYGWYTPSQDYWYVDVEGKIQKGCIPENQSYDNGTAYPPFSSMNDPNDWETATGNFCDGCGTNVNYGTLRGDRTGFTQRNTVPPFSQCYRQWYTDNATLCNTNYCQTQGKTVFKRMIMIGVGYTTSFGGTITPVMKWGKALGGIDNDSLIGTSFDCGSYPNGQCTSSYTFTALMDNKTGKIVDNGTHKLYDGQDFPMEAWSYNSDHICTYDNGTSCSYSE